MPELGFSFYGYDSRHTISSDGSRVFWSAGGRSGAGGHLYMRDVAKAKTIQLDVPEGEPGCPAADECGTGAVEAEFQTASSNGEVVFFADPQKLTANAAAYSTGRDGRQFAAADLYECRIVDDNCELSDIAPAGGVVGSVLGASEDGSWVYFVANGALAPGAVPGSCPNESSAPEPHAVCDLYVHHNGVTTLVAVLSGEDKPDWQPSLSLMTARVSPDGRYVAFMSQRSLTGYDNADAASGRPDEEVYLYHAPESLAAGSGALTCASCDPTGARPHGVQASPTTGDYSNLPLAEPNLYSWGTTWLAGNVPTWTPYASEGAVYQSRYLSDNGRLFFNSSDALVPKDGNGTEDVYQYEPKGVGSCSTASSSGSVAFKPGGLAGTEGRILEEGEGCVGLISSGESAQESAFLDASATGGKTAEGEGGGDVFFLTGSKLAPQDTDSARDVYDAQECTAAVPCPPQPAQQPAPCNTEASCKAAPEPQLSIFGPAGSATFSGPGNPAAPPAIKTVTKKKTSACKKGYVRKKVKKQERCVKKPKPKKRAQKASHDKGSK